MSTELAEWCIASVRGVGPHCLILPTDRTAPVVGNVHISGLILVDIRVVVDSSGTRAVHQRVPVAYPYGLLRSPKVSTSVYTDFVLPLRALSSEDFAAYTKVIAHVQQAADATTPPTTAPLTPEK
jgi:hypothetical protein